MSLINEALKKAQRAQDQAASDAPPVPGGTPVAKRGQARSANTMVLLGAGAFVLVLVSVVATVFLLNRGSQPKTDIAAASSTESAVAATPPAVAPASTTTATPPAAAPAASVPSSTPAATSAPATTAAITPAPTPSATSPSSARPPVIDPTAAQSSVVPAPAPATTTAAASSTSAPGVSTTSASTEVPAQGTAPAAPPSPAPAATGASDPRIAIFVDNIRVTGIRSSGNDSRVLMNDRVYRVNDIVERTLGIRLIKVDSDNLTFSDASGVTYVKYF